MAEDADEPDASSIKPVSSLRSRFEALNTPTDGATRPTPEPKPPKPGPKPQLDLSSSLPPAWASLDTPQPHPSLSSSPRRHGSPERPTPTTTRRRAPSPPKPRPSSMMAPSSPRHTPQRSVPHLNVSSPTSPPKSLHIPRTSPTRQGPLTPAGLRSGTPYAHANGHFRVPSRHDSLEAGSHMRHSVKALDLPPSPSRAKTSFLGDSAAIARDNGASPPINRTAKPRLARVGSESSMLARAPGSAVVKPDRKVSPFNTPPGSDESSSSESPSEPTGPSPPPLHLHTKPNLPLSNHPTSKHFAPPPTHHTIAGKRRDDAPSGTSLHQSSPRPSPALTAQRVDALTREDYAPALPPRTRSPSKGTNTTTTITSQSSKPSALSQGFSKKAADQVLLPRTESQYQSTPTAPKIRSRSPTASVVTNGRETPDHGPSRNAIPGAHYVAGSGITVARSSDLSEYPDSSRAIRRPPIYPDAPKMISVGYDIKLFDVCGDLVCATGTVTRVWSLLTGKLVLAIQHADTVKATALCFKPARKVEDDGTRIWLGTNWGDILEVDITAKRVVATNTHAHARREVMKLHRHGTEIWSLDEEGKLYVWPANENGTPDISRCVSNGRVARRPTTSTVIGDDLWLTFGHDVKVIKPQNKVEFTGNQSSPQKAVQQAPGDITATAIISDQPDRVYFGQADGKISIFSRHDLRCLEVLNISLYKISCLKGVGPYLWSGHSTGIMFVYDTRTKPWTVKKDWTAHDTLVHGIATERDSLWKLDRLPVLSLGSSELRIWDGMLRDDWLDDDMLGHEEEYCSFSTLTSLVMTWNVGATKPADLRYDEEVSSFFRKLLGGASSPDILSFGLQELVDLEDKKLTAKSFFKSKHKDIYGQEHLSSAYRAWRDHLSKSLDESMPTDEHHVLLHTASLVGLFSCVFVKASLKPRIRDVEAAEVKTGMGGLHGNKGAIVIRLILDDSSVCFVNCHLAAGQNQTGNRNNDIASILETTPLESIRVPANKSEIFIGGGDGSMILDNESCILNGDLNYRIDAMSRDSIVNAARQQAYAKLLERDQLLLSRRNKPGFRLRNFHEGQIAFAPTYKYDIGTDTYDTSEKRRSPAWCDRILYRGKVRQLEYRRHEVRVSDHRPVSSAFEMRIKTIRQDARSRCLEQSLQRFGKMKRHISDLAKLDYLHDVFGLSNDEGRKLLEA